MKVLLAICVFVIAAGLEGCAGPGAEGSRFVSADKAECLVCKHNADLACVDVKVDKDTPRAEYQGKTYYFCSETCRQEFLKNPAKYVAAEGH
jgi:YHS domain-containing protein